MEDRMRDQSGPRFESERLHQLTLCTGKHIGYSERDMCQCGKAVPMGLMPMPGSPFEVTCGL